MSGVERSIRSIVAALVIALLGLGAWSGGCSSTLVQPDAAPGGSGGTAGVAGTTGAGGAAGNGGTTGGNGGLGGSNEDGGTNPDAAPQCCTPGTASRCTDDNRRLMKCGIGGPSACSTPVGYSYALFLVECPNGCLGSAGGTSGGDSCQ